MYGQWLYILHRAAGSPGWASCVAEFAQSAFGLITRSVLSDKLITETALRALRAEAALCLPLRLEGGVLRLAALALALGRPAQPRLAATRPPGSRLRKLAPTSDS